MAQSYPATRRSPRLPSIAPRSPRKTVRRGLPANQNLREVGMPKGPKHPLRGLGRKAIRIGLGRGTALGALGLLELGEMYWTARQFQNPAVTPQLGEEGGWDMTGWLNETCGPSGTKAVMNSNANCTNLVGNRQISTTQWNAGLNQPLVGASFVWIRFTDQFLGYSGSSLQFANYTAPVSSYRLARATWNANPVLPYTEPSIGVSGQAMPMANPMIMPSIDPLSVPPLAPPFLPLAIPYRALPYRKVNPWRSPKEQRQFGNEAPLPWYPDGVKNPVDEIPYIAPPFSIGVGPAARLAKAHKRRPPDSNEKESKVRVNGVLSKLMLAGNFASEAVDVVEAIYKAIPYQFRPRYKNTRYAKRKVKPQEMMETIWRHHDEINYARALYNLVENELEDRIVGKFGKLAKDEATRSGRLHTLQHGAAFRRYWTYKAQNVIRNEEE